jgi:hypothetical protein
MNLVTALIIYAIVFAITYLIAQKQKIVIFSSIVLSLLIAQIVLSVIRPITSVSAFASENQTAVALYMAVQFLTPLIVVIYVFIKASTDKKPLISQ